MKLNRYNLMFKKYPIEAQFTGPDPAVLHQLADSARKIMENCPDVCLITTDWEPQVRNHGKDKAPAMCQAKSQ